MNWTFIIENIPFFQSALLLTLVIASAGIVGALLVGVFVSVIRYYRIPVLAQLATVYIELSRNSPLMIQLFFLYYGLPRLHIILSAEQCAIAGLIFLGGSYMAESLRSGLEAVPVRQEESGLSLGLSRIQLFRYVIFPQALAVSLPSISANIIFLIKETSVFSIIALVDLVFVAQDLIGKVYETDEVLLMLVISYLVILLPISLGCHFLERRIRHAGFGD